MSKFILFTCLLCLVLPILPQFVQVDKKEDGATIKSNLGLFEEDQKYDVQFEEAKGFDQMDSYGFEINNGPFEGTQIHEFKCVSILYTEFCGTQVEAFISSLGFIFLSEIGDKTFMYVMICSTQMSFLKLVFVSILALGGMHILSTSFGTVLHNLLSIFALKSISIFLFTIFGLNMIYEGITDTDDDDEDLEHKLEEVRNEMGDGSSHTTEKLRKQMETDKSYWAKLKSQAFKHQGIGVFLMIVAAEMGDMSQLTAIVLSANFGFWTVIFGGIIGFLLAILIAIFFGQIIMKLISERTMNILGGFIFLMFCAYELYSLINYGYH